MTLSIDIKMTATLFFKSTISTCLRLTDMDMNTMKAIDDAIVECLATAEISELISKNLSSLLSALYAARGCMIV